MEELGINSGSNLNSTYINQVNTVDELIQTHATTLADVFNIKLQQKEKNLPLNTATEGEKLATDILDS